MKTIRALSRSAFALPVLVFTAYCLVPESVPGLAKHPQGAQRPEGAPAHVVRTAKYTVVDVEEASLFYQRMFEMSELRRFISEGRLVEPFVGYEDAPDNKIGLLGYTEQETIEKSPYPVAVIFMPNLDGMIQRLEQAESSLMLLPEADTGGVRIVITRDPSGNALEIVERTGKAAVGGSRLIVDDRQEAQDFFITLFRVTPGSRTETEAFDQVLMEFGGDMFVALFEPKGVAPLPKSKNPVVAIYSTEFDAVLERVKARGLRHTTYGDGMFLVDDPSGNVVEVVRQRTQ